MAKRATWFDAIIVISGPHTILETVYLFARPTVLTFNYGTTATVLQLQRYA